VAEKNGGKETYGWDIFGKRGGIDGVGLGVDLQGGGGATQNK